MIIPPLPSPPEVVWQWPSPTLKCHGRTAVRDSALVSAVGLRPLHCSEDPQQLEPKSVSLSWQPAGPGVSRFILNHVSHLYRRLGEGCCSFGSVFASHEYGPGSIAILQKLCMTGTCRHQEVKAGASEVQHHPQLHSERHPGLLKHKIF